MAGELVERLRAVQHGTDRPYAASVAADAIDRIEALERENATLRAERDEARKLAIEEAALIAEAEPEFEEEPSPKVIEAMIAVGPMNNARAACAVTKKSIAAAIRNMGGGENGAPDTWGRWERKKQLEEGR